jgi:hypothetical protein
MFAHCKLRKIYQESCDTTVRYLSDRATSCSATLRYIEAGVETHKLQITTQNHRPEHRNKKLITLRAEQ